MTPLGSKATILASQATLKTCQLSFLKETVLDKMLLERFLLIAISFKKYKCNISGKSTATEIYSKMQLENLMDLVFDGFGQKTQFSS